MDRVEYGALSVGGWELSPDEGALSPGQSVLNRAFLQRDEDMQEV